MGTRSKRKTTTTTIAVGQTVSGEVNLNQESIIGFEIDGNCSGTTITLTSALAPGGTFVGLVNSGNTAEGVYTVSATTAKRIVLTQDQIEKLQSIRNFKLTSGTTQSTNPCVITVITKTTV